MFTSATQLKDYIKNKSKLTRATANILWAPLETRINTNKMIKMRLIT